MICTGKRKMFNRKIYFLNKSQFFLLVFGNDYFFENVGEKIIDF